jgi:hypothetical protein
MLRIILVWYACVHLLSGVSLSNDRVCQRWQVVGHLLRRAWRVCILGMRAVRHPCPRRACVAWAVSVRLNQASHVGQIVMRSVV